MNIGLDRRLTRVEEKISPPRLSPVAAMLCERPETRKSLAGLGVDVDRALRTGDLWGEFPRPVLKRLAERLKECDQVEAETKWAASSNSS